MSKNNRHNDKHRHDYIPLDVIDTDHIPYKDEVRGHRDHKKKKKEYEKKYKDDNWN